MPGTLDRDESIKVDYKEGLNVITDNISQITTELTDDVVGNDETAKQR
jgi:hypothetical protein